MIAAAILLIIIGLAGIGWGVFISFRLERERRPLRQDPDHG